MVQYGRGVSLPYHTREGLGVDGSQTLVQCVGLLALLQLGPVHLEAIEITDYLSNLGPNAFNGGAFRARFGLLVRPHERVPPLAVVDEALADLFDAPAKPLVGDENFAQITVEDVQNALLVHGVERCVLGEHGEALAVLKGAREKPRRIGVHRCQLVRRFVEGTRLQLEPFRHELARARIVQAQHWLSGEWSGCHMTQRIFISMLADESFRQRTYAYSVCSGVRGCQPAGGCGRSSGHCWTGLPPVAVIDRSSHTAIPNVNGALRRSASKLPSDANFTVIVSIGSYSPIASDRLNCPAETEMAPADFAYQCTHPLSVLRIPDPVSSPGQLQSSPSSP
uniref:Uncharacterized protein n=1 Tax=Anopheles atroparvus TaxID=41427 RepID=A0A182IKY8_ANOAO